ncbi:uncharacterized protein [Mytilus edulis]|uniref:uncharacterized protein n=1 Tax=Mytilus edulis TaxID=6550 RepID=UPI0039F111EA
MVNDLSTCLQDCEISQFADDGAIWKSGSCIKFLQKKIQPDLDNICKWCSTWGFKISPSKTVAMIFTRRNNINISLKLGNHTLEIVKEIKFLGLIFDRNLTWQKHIQSLQTKCLKVINCMRVLTGTRWGATSNTLRTIYISLIRSKLDYGCEIYNSASFSTKKCLDKIQNQALRICTGSMRSASLKALQVEMGDPPLEIRRQSLIAKAFLNMTSFDNSHPAKAAVNDTFIFDYYSKNVKRKPFSITARDFLAQNKFSTEYIYRYSECPCPPWHIEKSLVKTQLQDKISKKDLPHLIKSEAEILIDSEYSKHLQIFTDGSKDPHGNTSCAYVVPELKIKKGFKLPNYISIFMSELMAIFVSLLWLEDFKPIKTVIFVDSLSALQAIRAPIFKVKNQILYDIHLIVTSLKKGGSEIIFEWIPSHVGVMGNESADLQAKNALNLDNCIDFIPLFKEDIKTVCKNFLKNSWQKDWETNKDRSLFKIIDKINFQINIPNLTREKEILLFKLRTGYIGLNKHLNKIGVVTSNLCINCNQIESVEHC